MQRISRVAIDSNSNLELLAQYHQLLAALKPILSDRTFSFFGKPKLIDGDNYIGWYSNLEGQPLLLSEISHYKASIEQIVEMRIAEIEGAIKTHLNAEESLVAKQLLALIKDQSKQIYVINGDPVIVLDFAAHPQFKSLPTKPKTFWRGFRIALLMLFLLALLALLWYLFCPWGKERPPENIVIPPVIAPAVEEKPAPSIVPPPVEPVVEQLPAPLPIPKAKPVNDPNCITKDQLAKNRNPPRLVIALDDSQSMKMGVKGSNVSRFTVAKEAINAIIDKVEPNIEISLIQLHSNEGKKINIPFYSGEDRESLKTRVNNFKTVNYGSDTYEYDGLNQLAERFGQNSKKQKYYTLVVTDGEEICTCSCRGVLDADYKDSNLIDTKVINITGHEIVNCVFDNGFYGKIYNANTANEITKQINKAVENMKITRPVCVE